MMTQSLEHRRRKVVRELERVNRKINAMEKRLAQIQTSLAVLSTGRLKAA
jgi:hypothetical protein